MSLIPTNADAQLRQFADMTNQVLFAYHPEEERLMFLNQAFESVWELKREAISNLSAITDTVHPEDKEHVIASLRAIKTEKMRHSTEFRITCGTNIIKWIKLDAFVTYDNESKIIIGSAIDISENKAFDQNLHKFSDKKNSILSILSHDLRGPLGNILMTSQLLGSELNERDVRLVELIRQNSTRAAQMIDDLINQEFLESSEVSLKLTRTNIVEKVGEIIHQYRQSKGNQKTFEFKISSPTIFVKIDESKFLQAINNLLLNAVKFTREDGTITLNIIEEAEQVRFSVGDNGIGIPEDMLPFIFDKFTKARRPGLAGESTVGLGMSIIKTIVEWHRGKVWVESKEGKGTTVFITLPKEVTD